MIQLFVGVCLLLFSFKSYGSDLGFSQTRSSTSKSSRVRLSYDFSPYQKVTLVLRKTQLIDATDDKASGAKLTYRYKDEEGHALSVFLGKDDEAYFYESVSGGLQYGFDLSSSLKATIGVGGASKNYSIIPRETLIQRTINVNLDYEAFNWLGLGLSYVKDNYSGSGLQTERYLRGARINSTDIQNYLDIMIADSVSGYIEFVFKGVTLGFNATMDQYQISSSKALTTEVYLDAELGRSWYLGAFVSKGKTDYSSTQSSSTGFSLSYKY